MKHDIKIKYNGSWPCLCSGKLEVTVDGTYYNFGNCLMSGGGVSFNSDWEECVTTGPWCIEKFPKNFPNDEELRAEVLEAVNNEIPHGCCGGCV